MSFFGDFKRRPEQNLGGASRKLAREQLIQQAAHERRMRELHRKQTSAATCIQAYWRGYKSRKHEYDRVRQEFDAIKSKENAIQDLNDVIRTLLLFYSDKKDSERLTWLSQLLLKRKNDVISTLIKDTKQWLYKINSILLLNLKQLQRNEVPHGIPLRLLEVYTASETYHSVCSILDTHQILSSIWIFLIEKRFFSIMRTIIDEKTPKPVEERTKPLTPMAESLLCLIQRPLTLIASHQFHQDKKVSFISSMFDELFAGPFSPQVKYFLIPSLTEGLTLDLKTVSEALLKTDSGLKPHQVALAAKNRSKAVDLSPLWKLYTCSRLIPRLSPSAPESTTSFLHLLSHISPVLACIMNDKRRAHLGDDDDDEDYEEDMDAEDDQDGVNPKGLAFEIIEAVNDPKGVQALVSIVNQQEAEESRQVLVSLCILCHSLLSSDPLAVHKCRLLYTLAFKPGFLRILWRYILSVSTPSVFGSPTPLLQLLSRGLPLAAIDWYNILPQLTLFCSLFSYLLPTLDDVEFYESHDVACVDERKISSMPFSLKELADISLTLRDVCIGLVELAYHDTKPALTADYYQVVKSVQDPSNSVDDSDFLAEQVHQWQKLFKATVNLLRQLHTRDARRQFCPTGHWISKQVCIPVERPALFRPGHNPRRRFPIFVGIRHLTREQLEAEGPPPSTTEVRQVTILQEIPFVVAFQDRVKILQSIIAKDREANSVGSGFMAPGSCIQVMIRRNFIYEDAFEKLSVENEPNLKLPIRVQLVNAVGLDEAGIDGGGIFREFLTELLRTCFDPNRGFFKSTHDRLLYPNPGVNLIHENFGVHYQFIGRMLGKAIFENMLVELPFAPFFLAKMLASASTSDVDIHNLASLDPILYRNLVYLKNYDGDVADLGLDFTVLNNELGENEVVELKPGGANIPVTAQNRIEYIHLMADYRLNKQIRPQCAAFKNGLASIIDLDSLRMFDPNELQILISGAPTPIDIQDLKNHANYAGGYSVDHQVIISFWKIVESFDENQKKKLLKFVTSCSRPPLLGFKDLYPPFCIQNAGRDPERLPTASTCMNLLKLPEINDEKMLKTKLLYAIESGAGFELS